MKHSDGVRGLGRRVPARWYDVAVVVVSLVAGAVLVFRPWPPRLDATWLSAVVLSLAALGLLWRRSHPAVVFVFVLFANTVYLYAVGGATALIEQSPNADSSFVMTSDLSILFAAYALGAYGRRGRGVLGAAGAVFMAVTSATSLDETGPGSWRVQLVGMLLTVSVPWLVGNSIRRRRRHVAAVEERAARVEAERTLDSERAVVQERARIARELHDVVAHHVSVMGVQAGAARLALDRDPDLVRQALSAIEATSRQAVDEMRRMLGIMREPGTEVQAHGESTGVPSAPQPGLVDLAALADHFRQAGLPLDLTVDERIGPADGPPPEVVQLSAYRIVEQSLTNVLEHAGPARTSVYVRVDHEFVEVIVQNAGPAASRVRVPRARGAGRGHGSVGMRERVALFDGVLQHGSLPDGGYRVRARLATGPAA